MKKYLLLPILALAFFTSTQSFAQLSAGAGIAYGTEIEEIGVQVRGIYQITDVWRAGGDIIFWLDGEDDISIWELNLNAHYAFLNSGSTILYALAGLNIVTVKVEILGEDVSDSETGINLGAGAQIPFTDNLSGFAELRYVLGDADQLVVAGGVILNF